MGKNSLYIVSVGTSLIANYNKKMENNKSLKERYGKINTDELNTLTVHNPCEHKLPMNDFFYMEAWEKLTRYIGSINEFDELASLSAELSSILFWNSETKLRSGDRIILVTTNTPDASLCAHVLKEIIGKKWSIIGSGNGVLTIDIKTIRGLGKADDPSFGTLGLPNFLQYIVGTIRGNKNDFNVILVPTGGYKALIPYMVIAGILEEVPCRYVYEESKNVLELPPLPLHVDILRWVQIETVINVLEGKSDYKKNKIYKSFVSHLMGLLVPEQGGSSSTLKSSGLDQVLRERVRQVAGEPELVLRAKNSPLLTFMEDGQLKEMFLKLASIGHLIWKGDRVPEMVDHGLRHHNDLFLLAEKILLPIFYYKPDFLQKHELFTLLCALFLHDCGHVVGTVNLKDNGTVRLYPTEVRDYHHVLGYLRLKEPDKHGGTGDIIYKALSNEQELWENFLHAPAVLGLYHRKKMNLCSDLNYEFFDRKFTSLKGYMENSEIKVGKNKIGFERMALLACLLRIIDGLDEQASRTGAPDDVAFHLAQLETEATEEEARGSAIRDSLNDIPEINNILSDVDEYINAHMHGYTKAEGKGVQGNSGNTKPETLNTRDFRKKIDSLTNANDKKKYKPLIEEYIHSRLLKNFKEFQKSPYGEKVYIRDVLIEARKNEKEKVVVSIDLEMLDDLDLISKYKDAGCPVKIQKNGKTYNLEKEDGRNNYKKYMLGELEKEYLAEAGNVKKILENNGLIFEYKKEES